MVDSTEKIEIVIEGQFKIQKSWYSKNIKIFGSVLNNKPYLYYTDAETLKGQVNSVIPVLEDYTPKEGWKKVELTSANILAPTDDEDCIKIRYPDNKEQNITF